MVEGDLGAVAGIYAHYVVGSLVTFDEEPPGLAYWVEKAAGLRARGLPFIVVEEDGRVAGYAYGAPWRPKPAYRHTVEDSIYLAPGFRGRGLGRLLLGELLTRCADVGVREVIAVIADTGDDASARLHRDFGFTEAGRLSQVGRKHGRALDTLLMQRSLAT